MENITKLRNQFIHLFKYNDWATIATVSSLKGFEKKDERLGKLLSHIISAQKLWLNRVLNREIVVSPWDKLPIQESISQSTSVTAEWVNLLESFTDKDLDKRIEYADTKGEKYVNTLRDIIIHVINHSTYHRAQIAQRVKALGGKPAVTDYIVYQRELQDV
ncbi:MAG: DinB family protein [Ignavibacteriaceae bacterium]|jgi:uncharacterized damage-inducible protein DinB|nr:DinB family protein [Ignavibacteriaceae bacterium]MCW8812532.1 DinB family protein [Chlorobium sp.]MCW8960110.1 DinB family protein [Ignavibacteriaceae bacterium]MCW9097966.1 DinB family protein [Ignavibacteriaceae bacterium]